MRRLTLVILSIFTFLTVLSQDLVIFRNGEEFAGHVSQLSNKEIVFSPSQKGTIMGQQSPDGKLRIDPKNLYMIKLKSRGNYYFLRDGNRISGEDHDIPRGVDVIYLIKGGEIFSYKTNLSLNNLLYIPNKKLVNDPTAFLEVPLSEVFFIKYKDGTREIFNDLSTPVEPQVEKKTTSGDDEKKLKVVFCTSKAGQSLNDIAQEYNVSAEDIREWNDLPESYSLSKKLKAGVQFMIYVEYSNQ